MDNQYMAPGRTLIFVGGLILIITGILSVIVDGLAAIFGALWSGFANDVTGGLTDGGGGTIILYGVIGILIGIYTLVAGILFVKFSNIREKGMLMVILAAIGACLTILSIIFVNLWTVLDIVLYALVLAGGIMNKNSLAKQ